MNIKVFTIDSELESAKKLGFETSTYPYRVEDYDNYIVIRWGFGQEIYNRENKLSDFKRVINPQRSIQLNCRKNVALRVMSRVVNTPRMFVRRVPRGLYVYRPTHHTSGQCFAVNTGPFRIRRGFYATEFIRTETEFRVWFCGNATLCAKRVTQSKEKLNQKYKCRSLWAYRFWKKTPKRLAKQVIKAAKEIGLDFGCADILYKKGKYYFVEMNTAPSLDHRILINFYRTNLKKLIKRKLAKKRT